MTDEEIAINWIRSQGWNEENLPTDEFLQMEQAFLAGLKAGRDMAEADLATVAYMQGAENQKKKTEKQLTEAKNHIHRLLVLLTEGKRSYAVIDEARVFLREVSE